MTENPAYKEYEVRQAADYAGWIGEVVRVRTTDGDGLMAVHSGVLRGTADDQERRPIGGAKVSTVSTWPVVPRVSTFTFDGGHAVSVRWGTDVATIQLVLTDRDRESLR